MSAPDLTLRRDERRPDGIFSVLSGGGFSCRTLEHAYGPGPVYQPKIPPGRYLCARGPHRLHGMADSFDTFEITGVAGHANLLFHWGNWEDCSEGCVLVGRAETDSAKGRMITASRDTFAALMAWAGDRRTLVLDVLG